MTVLVHVDDAEKMGPKGLLFVMILAAGRWASMSEDELLALCQGSNEIPVYDQNGKVIARLSCEPR